MTYKNPISEPIAIVGSSCRFAGGATSPSKLWELLENPIDLSREIPENRFNIKAFFHEDGEYHGTTNSPKAYFLEQDHRVFDASFFNITPKEAEAIDPQQRLLLEVVYEAMESAGYSLQEYAGKQVAVFAGVMTTDYDTVSQRDDLFTSQYYATGNARSIISNRVSYFFNFHGPSMTIDTACSSSLVALHQAVLSLRSGECEMACVTGVNLILAPEQFIVESSLHMLSPTGHCRMWDIGANGYARGEGVTAMFVKPLSKALADGDRIEAIIRETGVNSDGRSKGITMPNWAAQSSLIQDTYRRGGLDPKTHEDRCQYFEAHGTGTAAGDPNEARAIDDAFFGKSAVTSAAPPKPPKMIVGSVKTLIGHTEGAAGLAGVLKVIQAMEHDAVPANLHLEKLNPEVEQYCDNLILPTAIVPWPSVPKDQPKRASVNSFGFGGTNSHAIIEQYVPSIHNAVAQRFSSEPSVPTSIDDQYRETQGTVNLPLLLSAASQKSLVAVAKTCRDYLLQDSLPPMEDIAWHIYARQTAFSFRLALTGSSANDLVDKIDTLLDRVAKSPSIPIGLRARPEDQPPKILGIFTGQGAQWATMSRGLLQSNKVYAETIQALDKILQGVPNPPIWSLEKEILAEGELSRIQQAAISQPLCTALQIALVDLLLSLGITFSAVVGHSSGEIAAAYACGRLTARDAILIAYYRGKVAHLAAGPDGAQGGMLAVGLSKEEAMELCARPEYKQSICVAASNSATSITLSGNKDTLTRVRDELTQQNKFARLLAVDTAYHSPHMERPAVEYSKALSECGVTPTMGRRHAAWISSVYGFGEPDDSEIMSSYWNANMVQPVLFYEALCTALEHHGPFDCAIEVGPHPALRGPATQTIKEKLTNMIPYTGLLDRRLDDQIAFSEFLGWMWSHFGSSSTQVQKFVLGTRPDLVKARVENIPLYPWDHSQAYYRESRIARQFHFRQDAPNELLGTRTRDDNEFELRWRNILKLDRLPWVRHHRFQNQALLPASAYMVMTVDAARVVLAGRSASIIELIDLRFPSGIILEENDPHGIEVLFSLILDSSSAGKQDDTIEGSFTLASTVADGRTSMRLNYSGKLRILLDEPSPEALPSRPAQRAETMQADSDAFYSMMSGTGLDYTGPFTGLTDLHRRLCFASATVRKLHPDDTTQLRISPATLDSSLQTAFVSLSSPGDGAIWTSFLPESVERARFNLSICDIQDGEELLAIDTYLTKESPFSRHAPASYTAEIDIYNAQGNMEIQVEGLTVASFAPTKPENDYELYLTTVLDVDPEAEIVGSTLAEVQKPSPMLIESCERVASFYVDSESVRRIHRASFPFFSIAGDSTETTIVPHPWHGETEESLEKFLRSSPYFQALQFVRKLGENLPDVLAGMLPTIVTEAHQHYGFQKQISRVVRQIAHKYPQMNVLTLTDPEVGLTEHILAGLGNSFAKLRVAAGPEDNLKERIVTSTSLRKRIAVDKLDLDQDNFDDSSGSKYDLVVLNTTLLEPREAPSTLEKIKHAMRPGAFLILVDISISPLRDRIRRCSECVEGDEAMDTPVNWPSLLDESGFRYAVDNSTQEYHPGFSFMVRQTYSDHKQMWARPFAHKTAAPLADRLLVVGGRQLSTSLIASGVCHALADRCNVVDTVESLDLINLEDLSSYSAAILLSDIDQPILANMTEGLMVRLRALLHPRMTMLWVTHNAMHSNPDHAASFGFTRTLAAETPGLTLQVLDLDNVDTPLATSLVSEAFARLAMESLSSQAGKDQPLWIHETEIHVENGKRFVPRVRPWEQGIERFNSVRRLVTKSINTLEAQVRLRPVRTSDGSTEYRSLIENGDMTLARNFDHAVLQVEFSTASPLTLSWDFETYVCLGRDLATGKFFVALSSMNASYITTPAILVSTVPRERLNRAVFIAFLVRYLAALSIGAKVQGKPVIFIEPDRMFMECIQDVFVKRGIKFQFYTTKARHSSAMPPGTLIVHPKSSAKDLKALYPLGGAWVINLLPETENLSTVLVGMLPRNCDYSSASSLLRTLCQSRQQDHDFVQELWYEAVALSVAKSTTWKSDELAPMVTVPALLEGSQQAPLFKIIDWKAERSINHSITPWAATNMLSADKTYVLIGVTRDFGQSLCGLLIQHGAVHIVLASRNPPQKRPEWQRELISKGIDVRFEKLDVTDLDRVLAFKAKLAETCPPVGGVVNGAMVLDDRVFSEMSVETFNRVMNPKTVGSKNLDIAFDSPDLEFFIMTSSFAAIGGHPGQSNYAAANMYMNGLAADRRRRGLVGSALNIGVIYGLGFLHREKQELYSGLAREGYPPISERDIHHMFIEAIVTGIPVAGQIYDITTGLRRYHLKNPTQHWHFDPRFLHFSYMDDDVDAAEAGGDKKSFKDLLVEAKSKDDVLKVFSTAFMSHLEQLLQLVTGTVTHDDSIAELGVDSLVAVEIRSWIWKTVAQDVAVMKILGSSSIMQLCQEIAEHIVQGRVTETKIASVMGLDGTRSGSTSSSGGEADSPRPSSAATVVAEDSVDAATKKEN
ncbi:hypothetical protein QBC47DRAFT_291072 [Echria macrotheca]|uniref:Uncharacterized protein n=1 Tax=Echria macrotheca TaxID=438768 RepID=A0AAJ0FFQ9_9PEZI|nr:hypothetical protein QBC47DRAFT_291072 [Echria macrotheca]